MKQSREGRRGGAAASAETGLSARPKPPRKPPPAKMTATQKRRALKPKKNSKGDTKASAAKKQAVAPRLT